MHWETVWQPKVDSPKSIHRPSHLLAVICARASLRDVNCASEMGAFPPLRQILYSTESQLCTSSLAEILSCGLRAPTYLTVSGSRGHASAWFYETASGRRPACLKLFKSQCFLWKWTRKFASQCLMRTRRV